MLANDTLESLAKNASEAYRLVDANTDPRLLSVLGAICGDIKILDREVKAITEGHIERIVRRWNDASCGYEYAVYRGRYFSRDTFIEMGSMCSGDMARDLEDDFQDKDTDAMGTTLRTPEQVLEWYYDE